MINWTFQRKSPLMLSAVAGMTQHEEDTFNQTGHAELAADPLPEERPVSELCSKTRRNESDKASIADSGMPVNTLCRAVRS